MSTAQKLLSIVWYKVLPPVFGGQKGIALFNQYLGEQVSLTCLCAITNEEIAGLSYKLIRQLPVNKRQFIDPVVIRKIISVAKQENPTHILLEHPYHAIAAFRAKKATGARIILHSHNIESERFHQAGQWWWRLLYRYERWAHRKVDLVLYKTTADKDYSIRHFNIPPEKCMVAPYGIEKKQIPGRDKARELIRQRHAINTDEKILLFAGTLDYTPNAAAVESIYSRIAPMLANENSKVKIIICGRNKELAYQYLEKFSHPLVIRAGEVDDIENYFAGADVFINPVLFGGGVQTKNIDALSYHLNTVCFRNMIDDEIIPLTKDKLFLVAANDWEAFGFQVQNALKMSFPTSTSFFEYYDWNTIIKKVKERMDEL
jgi:polysaccharide biosynthesis protein PslH